MQIDFVSDCMLFYLKLRFRGKSTNSLTLRLGAFQFDDRNVHVQVRGVAQIFIHPQFNFPLHDIAILQVS